MPMRKSESTLLLMPPRRRYCRYAFPAVPMRFRIHWPKAARRRPLACGLDLLAQNGFSFASPFFFFFLLEDSSSKSALGAFFFLPFEAVAGD